MSVTRAIGTESSAAAVLHTASKWPQARVEDAEIMKGCETLGLIQRQWRHMFSHRPASHSDQKQGDAKAAKVSECLTKT